MKVSVVMATYNSRSSRFLTEQIESVRKQSASADEVIIVDDNSSDDTAGFLEEYINVHSLDHWKVFRHDSNQGFIKNFSDGLSKVSGDVIILCDHDDIWDIDKVRMIKDTFATDDGILGLATGFTEIDENNNAIPVRQRPGRSNNNLIRRRLRSGLSRLNIKDVAVYNVSPGCTCAVRKTIVDDYMKIPTDQLPHDWKLMMIAACRDGLYYLDRVTTYYRIYQDNTIGLGHQSNYDKRTETARVNAEEKKDLCRIVGYYYGTRSKEVKYMRKIVRLFSARYDAIHSRKIGKEILLIPRSLRADGLYETIGMDALTVLRSANIDDGTSEPAEDRASLAEMQMKITFCIKGCATKPIGGHKVLYELANRLAARGHEITIVFPSADNLYQLPLSEGARVLLCKILTEGTHIMPPWFRFDRRVRLKTVRDYSEKHFPDADCVVATASETAVPVSRLPERCGRKVYFIQGYETWTMSEDDLNATFRLGMTNIVISDWLKEIVESNPGSQAYVIPDAIDTAKFKENEPLEERSPTNIGLLYHTAELKGLKYAFEALDIVRKRHPDVHVIMFGAVRPAESLPEWYEFHYRASEKEVIDIYNRCGIFACATIDEGFGLTGAESMACGCALASTDYTGVREYAKDEYNALLSPVCEPQLLADNICRLIEDNELRARIARNGIDSIQSRSWEDAVKRFEDILQQPGN